MIVTKKSMLIAKAEYLSGKVLTIAEARIIVRKPATIRQGDIKKALGITNDTKHLPLGIIVEKYIPTIDKMSAEQLIDVVKEITVKATSVDAGMRILRQALSKTRDGLINYLINLWNKDEKNIDRYKKAMEKKAYEGSYLMEDQHHYSEVDPYSRESGAMRVIQPVDPTESRYELNENGYPRDLDTQGNRAKRKTDKIENKKKKEYIPLNKVQPGGPNIMENIYQEIYDNTDVKRNESK